MTGLLILYTSLLLQQKKKWEDRDDTERWQKWEEYEDIREEMGHVRNVEPIPKRALHKKRKNKPRKKGEL